MNKNAKLLNSLLSAGNVKPTDKVLPDDKKKKVAKKKPKKKAAKKVVSKNPFMGGF